MMITTIENGRINARDYNVAKVNKTVAHKCRIILNERKVLYQCTQRERERKYRCWQTVNANPLMSIKHFMLCNLYVLFSNLYGHERTHTKLRYCR